MDSNQPLIEGTARDKLLVRIEKDRLEQARKDEEEKRKRQIEFEARQREREIQNVKLGTIYSICSVYRLLLLEMGMAPGPLSLEEFEVAETEFKKLAQQKVGSWILKMRFFNRRQRKWWKHYLEQGYFPGENQSEDRPLFFNKGAVIGWIYCMGVCRLNNHIDSVIEHFSRVIKKPNNYDHSYNTCTHHNNDGRYVPTNFLELYNQLIAKRIKEIKART